MNHKISGVLLLALLAGCASNGSFEDERNEEHLEMGPPPPGYWRILGDAVPGWKPEHMIQHGDGPGMWTLLGPRPMSNEYWSGNANAGGRTVGIAVDPTNANTVYIATASGGVWKTTNGGTSWTPLTDELSNLNSGAIAIDPSNPATIYLGTGEYQTSSGGDGVFRSTDSGATWVRIGTTAQVGSNISRIAVDPTNPLVIHVTGTLGYVRSTDGGATWSVRLSGAACSDLAVNPANPQVVYAARHSDGIYKSTNGGTSFVELAGGLPTSGMTRIILAMSRSSPDTIYGTFINMSSGLLGEYKTVDGGASWVQLTATPNYPSPQGNYDVFTVVHPTDPNTVYGGGVFPTYAEAGIIKTTDGGASWTDVTQVGGTQVHPDMQIAAFGPDNTLWVGCDGGVWKTTNGAASWINCNATLGATQHYQIALHPTDPNNAIGGTQDNGSAQRTSASLTWPQVQAGDGGFCCYDRTTPTRRYVTYVYLAVYRLTSGTTNITGPWGSESAQFIAPLVPDPNSSTTLLGGTNRVWRTTNASSSPPTWTALNTAQTGDGTLTAIAVATGASNTIYSGSSTGRVYQTTDAVQWNNRSAGLPSSTISDIIVNPTSPGVAYVSVSTTSGNRVLRTDNFGANWTSKTGTLPSGVRGKALEIDWRFTPPVMYLGTGVGIYWSFDDGATWIKDGTDFPNVNIGDLKIDRTLLTITAGTYGRGVWRANLLTPPAPPACYANCDLSTTPPILNVQDFSCFLNRFAAGDTYANCDLSTTPPVLNVQDFSCFLNAFAAGCT